MSKKTFTMKNKKASKVYKCDGQLLRKIITDKGFMPTELSRMMDYCSDYLNSCTRKNKISDVCVKKLMGYRIFPQMYGIEGEIKVEAPKEVKIDKDESLKKIAETAIDKDSMYDLKRPEGTPDDIICAIPKETAFYTEYGVVRSEKDLRNCIRQVIDLKHPYLATNLIAVRNILEKACSNGLSYDIKDMQNDLLVYAMHVGTYPEKWVEFVNRLHLRHNPYSRSPFAPTAQEIKEILNAKYGTLQSIKDPDETAYESLEIKMLAIGIRHFIKGFIREAKNDPEIKAMIKQAVKEAYEEL